VADAPAKCASTICRLSNLDRSPIFRFFHTDSNSTQSIMHWHEHYRMYIDGKITFVTNWSSFNIVSTVFGSSVA
jgi:hypothetical protein